MSLRRALRSLLRIVQLVVLSARSQLIQLYVAMPQQTMSVVCLAIKEDGIAPTSQHSGYLTRLSTTGRETPSRSLRKYHENGAA